MYFSLPLSKMTVISFSLSSQITVRVFQHDTKAHFWVCEKSVWHYANGGTWGMNKGGHLLHMNGSGTSGLLRFESDATDHPEYFVCAVGIHNYKPWGSIVAGLPSSQTCALLHSQFYSGGPHSNANLNDVGTCGTMVDATKRNVQLTITDLGNKHYRADVVISRLSG